MAISSMRNAHVSKRSPGAHSVSPASRQPDNTSSIDLSAVSFCDATEEQGKGQDETLGSSCGVCLWGKNGATLLCTNVLK